VSPCIWITNPSETSKILQHVLKHTAINPIATSSTWVSANDVNVLMWDGSVILAGAPSEEASTEATGAPKNVACQWEQGGDFAHFFYVDNAALTVEYFNFTRANTWSETTIDAAATSAGNDVTKLMAAHDYACWHLQELEKVNML